MASVKLAYMPHQDNNRVFAQYSPADPPSRSNSAVGSGIWSSAPPATPQSSSSSFLGSAWASPLAVSGQPAPAAGYGSAPSAPPAHSSSAYATGTKLLADLTVGSEPVEAERASPGPSSISAYPSSQSLSSASSCLSSRHNSQTEVRSPLAPSPTVSSAAVAPTGGAPPNASPSDEIINTAIVVKNIPFAIKKEQLIDFMTQLGLPLPYAFNYHFDNGVFRGLAFANFTTADETAAVISTLNGRELGGRRLRVEYKKMLPFQERERIEREKRERRGQLEEQHQQGHGANGAGAAGNTTASISAPTTPPHGSGHGHPAGHAHAGVSGAAAQAPLSSLKVDMNDPDTLQMYSSLLVFKHDQMRGELVVPHHGSGASLNTTRTHLLGTLCRMLDLNSLMTEEQDIIISKPGGADVSSKNEIANESPSYLSGVLGGAIAIPAVSAAPSLSRVNPTAIGATQNITALSALNRWNSVSNLSGLASSNAAAAGVAPGVAPSVGVLPQSWATGAGGVKAASGNNGDMAGRANLYDTVFQQAGPGGADRRH